MWRQRLRSLALAHLPNLGAVVNPLEEGHIPPRCAPPGTSARLLLLLVAGADLEGGPVRSLSGESIHVFSTCPASNLSEREGYLRQVIAAARWSEEAGCEGILVYTDNGLVDPWLVAEVIVEHTERLCPLVAVQPVYMHPYAVAKMVASLAFLHERRVYLNMVAGGFKNDLVALGDATPHDARYARLVEYTSLILDLVQGEAPVTRADSAYPVANLKLTPPVPPELRPGVFVSGSSPAGMEAARRLGATAVQYPKPVADYEAAPPEDAPSLGIRIGIVAREGGEEAWRVARARFPEDRRGQLTHQVATKVSDSAWHGQLSRLGAAPPGDDNPYWLVPFENYKTFCPYLVGSYDRVAAEVARYVAVGYRTFILDVPASPEDLRHVGIVYERALDRASR